MKEIKKFYFQLFVFLFLGYLSCFSHAEPEGWFRSGANDYSQKYSSISEITASNIRDLERAWIYKSGAIVPHDTVQTNPVFTGQNLITTTLDGRVIALSPIDGKLLWQRSLPPYVGRRGLTYSDERIFVPTGAGVYSLDAATGEILGIYGKEVSYLPPVVDGDLLLTADVVSGVSAYSVRTNKKNGTSRHGRMEILLVCGQGFPMTKKQS